MQKELKKKTILFFVFTKSRGCRSNLQSEPKSIKSRTGLKVTGGRSSQGAQAQSNRTHGASAKVRCGSWKDEGPTHPWPDVLLIFHFCITNISLFCQATQHVIYYHFFY